jgi:hypothetical protein
MSFHAFCDRIGLRQGNVGAQGRYMQAVLRDNLEGSQSRDVRKWFADECERINVDGWASRSMW